MTGAGLVFSATPEKVAARRFIPTKLINPQWNECELCTKQKQGNPKGHYSTLQTLWWIALNRRQMAKRTLTLTHCLGLFWSWEHEEDVPSALNVIWRCDTFPLALRSPLPRPDFWHVACEAPTTPTRLQQRDAVWVGLLPQEVACRPELPFHLVCLRATRSGQWRLCPVTSYARPYVQRDTPIEHALTGSRPLVTSQGHIWSLSQTNHYATAFRERLIVLLSFISRKKGLLPLIGWWYLLTPFHCSQQHQ